jgi:hypothetical protein
MLSDTLQRELLTHSPTFRAQVSAGLLSVGLERWKYVSAMLTQIEIASIDNRLTAEQAIGRTLATAEQNFLAETLAKQGVRLSSLTMSYPSGAGSDQSQASAEIDRLIAQLFARADWTWTVTEWLAQQGLAQHYINGQILALLTDMAAAPTLQ